ncbi:Fic family protein [Curtanaerobium respiraculi]|uniref:Fic family protein n=1 Tax=Curtanaerobium respiraculi TaxID=2949669 RepID=UPI0024B3B5F1|nr:Fic family protein [Curtanaerobium respiraculi]
MHHDTWPLLAYEEIPWQRSEGDFEFIPKSARRKISPTYLAAVPREIESARIDLSSNLMLRLSELRAEMARFDAGQMERSYNLPALLLRSESSASSQIERLTSSVRNVALAELSEMASANALMIARNVRAMRTALALPDTFDENTVLSIHRELAKSGETAPAGEFRSEQVWIGGTAFSPHGARFVPPAAHRIPVLMADWRAFVLREDIDPLAKAAVAHAQFETIHPFTDGNGRCGRTLIHKMLRRDGILETATLPVSAGLLHHADAYMTALDAYHEGDCESIITQVANAAEIALALGSATRSEIDNLIGEWEEAISERKNSAIRRLPELVVEQPVVDTAYVARKLSITPRSATTLIARACELGILRKIGAAKRGAFYQAPEIIAILDRISSREAIRRTLSES